MIVVVEDDDCGGGGRWLVEMIVEMEAIREKAVDEKTCVQ